MSDDFSSGGSWSSGAVRVIIAWLLIAFAVWGAWMLIQTGDRLRTSFVLIAMLVASAVFSPVYGGIAYAVARRRELPATARGALWTSVVLFILSACALAYGMVLLSAVGRGLR